MPPIVRCGHRASICPAGSARPASGRCTSADQPEHAAAADGRGHRCALGDGRRAGPLRRRALEARRRFLADFFAREAGDGYGDRFVGGALPAGLDRFAYPYATQTYLLWADVLREPGRRASWSRRCSRQAPTASPFLRRPGRPIRHSDQPDRHRQAVGCAVRLGADPVFRGRRPARHAFSSAATAAMVQWIAAVHAFFAETAS